jgi:PAS domain S-box-containing protein
MLVVAGAALLSVLVVDFTVVDYVAATAYLIVVVLAATTLPLRSAVVVSGAALILTLVTLAAQGRLNGETLILTGIGALTSGAVLLLTALYERAVSDEARFRDILSSTVDGLYRVDLATGRFDYVSRSMSDLTGIPPGRILELTADDMLEYLHPDDRAAARAAREELATKGGGTQEARLRVGGEYRWYQNVTHVVPDDAGQPRFAVGSLRDITARKRREIGREFQAKLRDDLSKVTSAEEVMTVTAERLGRALDVRYVFFAEHDEDGAEATSWMVWDGGPAHGAARRDRLSDFLSDEVVTDLQEGRTVVCHDAATDPRVATDRFTQEGVVAWIIAPFRRAGAWRFAISVGESTPRAWRDDEADLLGEVAARTFPRIERARAEAALRASEERFRTIVTHASEGISMTDADGRTTFINDAFADRLGYSLDEVRDMTPFDFVAEEDHPALAQHLRSRGEGVSERYDLRIRTKSGEWRWFLIDAAPIMDDHGVPRGDVALFTDITERKEWESALALQAHLLENVHDAIFALDESYRIIFWNEAAEELFGFTREEALGRESRELLRDAPDSTWDEAMAALQQDGWYAGEVKYRHKNGRAFWADARSRVVRRDDGSVEGVVASFRDIGEQRRAKEALAWEAARLRAIVEAAPVGLSVVAADGEVLLRNDVLRRMWVGEAGTHADDPGQGRGYWPETGQRVRPEEWPAALALADGTASSDVVVDIERLDGSRGTIVISAAPIVDDGAVLGAVSIAQDITHLREAEQALRFLTEEVRSLHEGVVLDASVSRTQLAYDVVVQAGLLLGSDGTSIFLLDDHGALRRIAGVGEEDPPGTDDLVAQAIGERTQQIRPLPPPAWDTPRMPGSVLLAVPLVVRSHVFGALAFVYRGKRALDDAQRRIAGAFADQAALAIENARLRAAIEETAIEAERTRLARDLHDSVTQSLFAASLKAEALMEMLDGQPGQAADAAQELRRLARGALAGMRTMLIEMRAGGLTETPLPELLRHLVEASGSRFGADVQLTTHGRRELPADVQTALYRIAQEALNNVARHAQASRAWVDLRLGDDGARLEIGDDGLGFEQPQNGSGHFGLENMHDRAAAIGAELTVDTGDGRGTVVTVEWPLEKGRTH